MGGKGLEPEDKMRKVNKVKNTIFWILFFSCLTVIAWETVNQKEILIALIGTPIVSYLFYLLQYVRFEEVKKA